MIRQLLLSVLLLLSSAFSLAAEKIPVVASCSILGDLISVVGGDRVLVSTLVGPDQDAHLFEPRPRDVKTLAQARLFVVNGLGFEGWLERLQNSANFKGVIVVASRGIKTRQMEDEDHPGRRVADPHAWQNPANVIEYVHNVAAALSQIDPANAAYYKANSEGYVQELKALDQWAVAQYNSIPKVKRRLITSHDAFGYHGAHFGVQFMAPQGVTTESEPSAKEVSRLIRQIKQEKIRAVFMENMSNPQLLEQLSRDAGIMPTGKLYADALSSAEGPASTYLKMMRYNVEQILIGLRRN